MFQDCGFLKRLKLSLWSITEQLRHIVNHVLQVMGCPILLWVKVCNFTLQLMGSGHLLNKDLCVLHLANVTLRTLSGSHCQQNLFVGVSVQFLVNFWSLPLQFFHLKRRAGRQQHKLRKLTCETDLRLFQIYDANLWKTKLLHVILFGRHWNFTSIDLPGVWIDQLVKQSETPRYQMNWRRSVESSPCFLCREKHAEQHSSCCSSLNGFWPLLSTISYPVLARLEFCGRREKLTL